MWQNQWREIIFVSKTLLNRRLIRLFPSATFPALLDESPANKWYTPMLCWSFHSRPTWTKSWWKLFPKMCRQVTRLEPGWTVVDWSLVEHWYITSWTLVGHWLHWPIIGWSLMDSFQIRFTHFRVHFFTQFQWFVWPHSAATGSGWIRSYIKIWRFWIQK